MLGLLAALMALLRSQAGRTFVRCLTIVGILFVYNYLIIVKIIIAFLVMSEIAAWMLPLVTPPQPANTSTVLPPEASLSYYDETPTGPHGAPWREQEEKQEKEVDARLKHFAVEPERGPPMYTPAANTSNASNRTGPSRSNWRQQDEIDRHLQRLAMAAAAADAAAAPTNVLTSHYYSASVLDGYPDRVGDTLGTATFSSSNISATQVQSTDFWTRSQYVSPTAVTQASSTHLRYGSRGLGHSKSLPESPNMYNNGDVYRSWKG